MKAVLLVIRGILILTLAGWPLACASNPAEPLKVDEEGNSVIDTAALNEIINETPAAELSAAEKAGIIYIREEEKLARDVYQQLYSRWGTGTFNNIGNSEQTHMDAVASLITRYDLADPAAGLGSGEFTDPQLQELYNGLIQQGSASEIEALKVGAAIEEIDILDIEGYLQQTDKADIRTVYESLLKGSRNHLRSFVSVMAKRGTTYAAQYLSREQFNEIINTEIEKGGG